MTQPVGGFAAVHAVTRFIAEMNTWESTYHATVSAAQATRSAELLFEGRRSLGHIFECWVWPTRRNISRIADLQCCAPPTYVDVVDISVARVRSDDEVVVVARDPRTHPPGLRFWVSQREGVWKIARSEMRWPHTRWQGTAL
jgi:hypothetical protein